MPIRTSKVNSLNLFSIKRAIETISKNAITLKTPGGGDMFLGSLPSVAEWSEGDAMFANDGGTMKLVFKMNALRHTLSLTQE